MVTLPLECTIDIRPFVYAKDDLKRMGEDKTEYAWKTEELVSWDWNEEVWLQRRIRHEITGVHVVPAFLWKPKGYQAEISTIFSKVECILGNFVIGEKSLEFRRRQLYVLLRKG